MADHDSQDKSSEKEDGSVWTSYSDMFTTMAVIFLVMFVFALLRSGINTLQTVQQKKEHEEFVKGQVPDKVIKENDKRRQKLEQSVQEMQQYQDIITTKMVELNQFSKKMQDHRQVVEKLLKDQETKEVVIKNLNVTLAKKDQEFHSTLALVRQMEQERKQNEREMKEIQVAMKKVQDARTKLEQELETSKQRMVEAKNRQQKELEQTKAKLAETQKMAKTTQMERDKFFQEAKTNERRNATYKKDIEWLQSMVGNLEKKGREAMQAEYAHAQKEAQMGGRITALERSLGHEKFRSGGLESRLGEATGRAKELGGRVGQLEKDNQGLQQNNSRQQKELTDLTAKLVKLDQQEKTCAENKRELIAQNREFRDRLGKLGKGLADFRKSLRGRIANRIADKLANSGVNVIVDKETGKLIMRMEGDFTFERDSSILRPEAKEALKRVVPRYTQALLGDVRLASKIESVAFVGHASPEYKKTFVDPLGGEQDAYTYNLTLSTDRAREIVKYIFSEEFGQFENKDEFRLLVSAGGRSFSEPIIHPGVKSGRTPASVIKDLGCGEYDCRQSRRVEIVFTLKDHDEGLLTTLESLNQE
ncbi:MAG: hypothetical protein HYV97_00980 [Bdellovibrio sp.]|nr:hypothetical protein [Bdellovibrio sp.]